MRAHLVRPVRVLAGLTLALLLALARPAPMSAQSLTASGNPGSLVISTATAGSQPTPVQDATTTYGVTSAVAARITGAVDQALPPGVTLKITLQAPTGATSAGAVPLSTAAQDLVTGIPASTNQSGLTITYRLEATVSAGVVSPAISRTITLRLVDVSSGTLATAVQTVSAEVQAIKVVSVSVPSPALTVSGAVAGQQPTPVTSSGEYAITVNNAVSKITGEVDAAPPAGTTLSVLLNAVGGGSSAGTQTLGAAPIDLVTGIGPVASSTPTLALTFAATVSAGVLGPFFRTVTYTIITVSQ